MIKTTNDPNVFWKKHEHECTYIYGCGEPSKWVTYYMEKCNISFAGYIDKAATTSDLRLNGKKIFSVTNLVDVLPYDKVRVIIAVGNPAEALSDLHFMRMNWIWNAGYRFMLTSLQVKRFIV